MTRQGAPIRFLLGVTGIWCLARSVMLWPPSLASLPRLVYAPPLAAPVEVVRGHRISLPLAPPPLRIALDPPGDNTPAPATGAIEIPGETLPSPTYVLRLATAPEPPPDGGVAAPIFEAGRIDRWSASSWGIVRPGDAVDSLAAGGLLGGSQAGVRLAYALDDRGAFAVAARLSSPLSLPSGREAAFGVDWRPIDALPLRLSIERRVALDRGGRDAFAVGIAGGVSDVALPAGFRLDGYAQGGVVGVRSRDAYVDGALRIERPLWRSGRASIALGVGAWGAAQPGAARLDLGPQAVLRIPAGATTLRLGVDWRQRVAGDARPGSGPALTIGADF